MSRLVQIFQRAYPPFLYESSPPPRYKGWSRSSRTRQRVFVHSTPLTNRQSTPSKPLQSSAILKMSKWLERFNFVEFKKLDVICIAVNLTNFWQNSWQQILAVQTKPPWKKAYPGISYSVVPCHQWPGNALLVLAYTEQKIGLKTLSWLMWVPYILHLLHTRLVTVD